jgi:hypothetical protein
MLPLETLEKDLNRQLKIPSFPASAASGYNVVATLKRIVSMTVASVKSKI